MSQLFPSGGQSIRASASVLPINIQGWFPLGWTDLIPLAVQGTLQHHNSKASILQYSAFFMVQLSHPNMTTGKNIALIRWTFVGKVMSLLFNMLPRPGMLWFMGSQRVGHNSATELNWTEFGHSFTSKEQESFNFMAAVNICNDFGAQENKACHCFHCLPMY